MAIKQFWYTQFGVNSVILLDLLFVLQNELTFQDVIKLAMPDAPAEGPDGTKISTIGMTFSYFWLNFVSGLIPSISLLYI